MGTSSSQPLITSGSIVSSNVSLVELVELGTLKCAMYFSPNLTGVPEYDVPPCEPLLVPALSVQQAAGPISVSSSYHDVTISGPSKMRIKDVQ